MSEPVEEIRTVAADGWPLGLVRRRPAASRGAVLLLHAMMADGRSMERGGLVDALVHAGFDAFVADFRGRGRSPTPPGRARAWTYDDLVLRDVPALVAEVRRRHDGPLAVLGHSLGGHVTAAALACGAVEVDALVAVAANVWLRDLEPDPAIAAAKEATLRAFAGVARLAGRFPARALRVGPVDEPAPYVDDLARFWRTGRWTSRDGRHDWGAGQARVEAPVLAVLGTGDTLYARPPGAAAWAARFPRHRVWLAGGGAHGVAGRPGHMGLITDPASGGLHREIAGWLADATAPHGQVGSRAAGAGRLE